ncbi:hypothetical protein BUALT_Bualt13G0045700 [Buddleja alternifolia]|uniref:C2H2-type domain-containing protein n=1 Tax=Buddleja alternifolia TaxID=168488 RepID=A0AAV6WSG6_9LAMI|nr:hypothetical protein BUALT_Bualt13G0045700 [Buddleja alternifolia]
MILPEPNFHNENQVDVKSKKQKRGSSLKICEPKAIDSRCSSKDNDDSNSTINEQLKGAKCNTEARERVERCTGTKSNGCIDNQGAKCRTGTKNNGGTGGRRDTRENPQPQGESKGKAKCCTRRYQTAEKVLPTDSNSSVETEKLSPTDSKSSVETEVSPEKHICEICNRSFPSHQALGGHRSSHNKFKITIVNTRKNPGSSRKSPNDDKICNKKLPLGRGFGGTKRFSSNQGSVPSPNRGKDQKVAKTARKVLLFDLNEMPDDEDEDEDDSENKIPDHLIELEL